MATFMGNGLEVFLFVENGVVEDKGGVGPQRLAKHMTRPIIDQIGVGGT
ncbi:MAG: hypothetical protein PHW76_09035 [Alphaproteobacteria bacterium]|nr:hypothetical protein [Alphaproteobacteria bacterium]